MCAANVTAEHSENGILVQGWIDHVTKMDSHPLSDNEAFIELYCM